MNAARKSPETFNVLRVDSEEPALSPISAAAHLKQRDGWDLKGIHEEAIHLMIQVMETWFIADPEALKMHYNDPRFQESALPRAANPETVSKAQVYEALQRAAAKTQKGEYHKISHAADLLKKIRPEVVRQRCRSCERLFATLIRQTD